MSAVAHLAQQITDALLNPKHELVHVLASHAGARRLSVAMAESGLTDPGGVVVAQSNEPKDSKRVATFAGVDVLLDNSIAPRLFRFVYRDRHAQE